MAIVNVVVEEAGIVEWEGDVRAGLVKKSTINTHKVKTARQEKDVTSRRVYDCPNAKP